MKSHYLPLIQLFEKSVASFPSQIFLKTRHVSLTYQQFYQQVQRRQYELKSQGVDLHHRLVYKGNPSLSMVESMFATWYCGAVFVPLCPTYPKDYYDKVDYIVKPFSHSFRVSEPPKGYQDHLALVLFTSGTTSFPKGVLLSHENICANLHMIHKRIDPSMISSDDTSFCFLPWYHCYGLVCELLFLMTRGASLYIPSSFQPQSMLSELRTAKPTLLFTVPKFLERVRKTVLQKLWFLPPTLQKRACFGNRLRYMSIGGASCSNTVQEFFQNRWKLPLVQGYGITECSPMISLSEATHMKPLHHCGFVFPEIETRLDENQVLYVRGSNLSQGYLTADNTISRPTEKYVGHDWFCTGDQISFDAQGRLSFQRRYDDTHWKLSNGKFINPFLIEQYILELDMIEQVVVLGQDSPSIKLLVHLSPNGHKYSHEKIQKQIRNYLCEKGCQPYELPSHILFLMEPLSVVSGTLTMKLEPKRYKLEKIYQDHFT